MNQKKVIIKLKKIQKKEPLCTWRSGQKQLLSSVVMTRSKMKMKKKICISCKDHDSRQGAQLD